MDAQHTMCFLTDGETCAFTAEATEPPMYQLTFYAPAYKTGTQANSEYKLFLIQLITDFGGKQGETASDEALKFMIDSSVTLCTDFQVLNFSFNKYCEVR